MFIATVPVDEADGAVRDIYAALQGTLGHVPNYAKAFSLRPEVYAAWAALIGAIRGAMDPRRYELVTVAAAQQRRNSYCSVVHGKILRDRFHPAAELVRIVDDPAAALDERDAAILAFARQVAGEPSSVTDDDVQRLRDLGLTDAEIFDIAAATSARCFFSTLMDALGAQPDAVYAALEPDLLHRLAVGRPVDDQPVERLP